MTKNGRNNQRISLSRVAGITFPGQRRHIYPTQDISLTGIFVSGPLRQPPGTPCTITLTERWSGKVFVMNFTGEVVRHNPDGMAIQFTEMALKQYALLQTVLLYGCSNPLSLGKEFAKGYPFQISEYQQKTA